MTPALERLLRLLPQAQRQLRELRKLLERLETDSDQTSAGSPANRPDRRGPTTGPRERQSRRRKQIASSDRAHPPGRSDIV